jgi:chaperonin GroEL
LDDLGLLTKSEVLDTELGMSFENADVKIMGGAKKVIVTKEETVFINGNGDKVSIQERIQGIREEMEKSTSEYDREKL